MKDLVIQTLDNVNLHEIFLQEIQSGTKLITTFNYWTYFLLVIYVLVLIAFFFQKNKNAKPMITLTLITIMGAAAIQTLAGNTRYYIDSREKTFNSQEGKELISQLEQDLKNFVQNPKDIKNFNLLTQKAIEKCNIAQIDTKDKPEINKCIIEKIYYDFPNLSK